MTSPVDPRERADIEAQVAKLLRKIGWDASDLAQIEGLRTYDPRSQSRANVQHSR
jgi:hypothetical protein